MKATFENSVNVLVKAYFNGTLEHGNCHACAVGNLVTQACGFSYKQSIGTHKNLWAHKDKYYENDQDSLSWYSVVKISKTPKEGLRQIEATGYSIDGLSQIETAFESADWAVKDRMFDGLMRVVDVLAEIHGMDFKAKQEAKSLFVKV